MKKINKYISKKGEQQFFPFLKPVYWILFGYRNVKTLLLTIPGFRYFLMLVALLSKEQKNLN